jgi:hypothetical protein
MTNDSGGTNTDLLPDSLWLWRADRYIKQVVGLSLAQPQTTEGSKHSYAQ